nr:zinc finger, SWIM-type [Tanacetum cinerariifolium]
MSIPLWTLQSTQEDVDVREFYVLEVSDMVNKLGYSDKVTMFYHFKKPGCDLDEGLHTLRNDSDVLALGEYVTEISTPKNSCIVEAPDDIISVKRPNKLPPKKCSKSACARNLLGWNEIRDRLGVGQSSQVTKVGQGSQSNPTPIVQPSAFVDDFYAVDDPFNGQGDFEPLFCLDDIAPLVNVDGTVKGKGKAIEVDVGDKGKGIAFDDEIESLEDAEDEEQGSEEEESDIFWMWSTLEFNANDEIEVDMDVMDPDEFESASDEDGLERIRSRKLKQLRKQGKTKDGSVHNTVFFIGKEFATADDVKKDIHKLSIETGRELLIKENDKVRVRAECSLSVEFPMF